MSGALSLGERRRRACSALSSLRQEVSALTAPSVTEKPLTREEWIEQRMIQTEDGLIVPLRLTSTQKRIFSAFDEAKERNDGLARLMILKSRRTRASTAVAALSFHYGMTEGLSGQSLTLTSDAEVRDTLYWMTRRFVNHWEECPEPQYARRGLEFVFPPPIDYRFAFQISSDYSGTSATLQFLHWTEVAKSASAAETRGSVAAAARMAHQVWETTANGEAGDGKFFFDWWKRAEKGAEGWLALFIAWFEHEEYVISEGSTRFERVMDKGLSDEERALQDAYNLSDGQLAWRRWTIDEEYGGNADWLRQEFPSNPDEAFLRVEGSRVFDMAACRMGRARAEAVERVAIGNLRWTIPPVLDSHGFCQNQSKLKVNFVENDSGYLTLYEWPPDDESEYTQNRYIIPADVALGIEGGDDSHAPIIDRRSRKIIATWHGQMDADLFGEELAKIVIWLRHGECNPVACPETNSMGNTTLTRLFNIVGGVHVWRQEEHAKGSPYVQSRSGKYGFYTGPGQSGSKESAVQCLVSIIREHGWFDPDVQFWSEALSVVREPNGVAALNGRDRTSARCIGAFMDHYGTPAALRFLEVAPREPNDSFARAKKRMHARRSRRFGMGLSSRKGFYRG